MPEILKKNTPLLVIILVAGLSIGIFLPFVYRLDQARALHADYQRTLAQHRLDISKYGAKDQALLERELAHMLTLYPKADELTNIIHELQTMAEASGLKVESMAPLGKISVPEIDFIQGSMNEALIKVEITGVFENIASFLSSFPHLKQGVLRIKSLTLLPVEGVGETIVANLVVAVFVRDSKSEAWKPFRVPALSPEEKLNHFSQFKQLNRDPFKKNIKFSSAGLILEGIIFDPLSPMVLMNGEVKRVGEKVGDVTIVEIHRAYVIFQKGDEKLRVDLTQG